MFFTITDMHGHEIKLQRPNGMQFGLQVDIKLNDGSDPTEVQLMFDNRDAESLEKAIGFFT